MYFYHRELCYASDMGQDWADRMSELLYEVLDLTKLHGGQLSEELQETVREDYRSIIADGYEATGGMKLKRPEWQKGRRGRIAKPKYRNLLERLDKRMDWVLLFTTDARVPFSNNLAERPVRPVKTHLKVAGCFRSDRMAQGFLRMRSYMDTCMKHGINGFQAIKMLADGELPDFVKKWLPESLEQAA